MRIANKKQCTLYILSIRMMINQEKGKEETRGDKFDLHYLSSSHCQEESCYDHAVF